MKPTLFQGESSLIETNPFRNNALNHLIESSYKVGWGEAHLLLEWALDSLFLRIKAAGQILFARR